MGFTGNKSEKAEKEEEEIDPRCIVKFRPADDWEGEYGFDWFREGDYGEKDNNNGRILSQYENSNDSIVGRYIGNIKFCDYGNLDEIKDKDEFTDRNGNTLYRANYNQLLFYSKSFCSNCLGNSCRYHFSPEVPMIDEGTRRPIKVDPDQTLVLSSFEFSKQDSTGNDPNYYAKRFKKDNYLTIPIIGSQSDYIVPTISLFYKDDAFTQDEWGKTEVKVRLLIEANNDISSISFVKNTIHDEIEVFPDIIYAPFPSIVQQAQPIEIQVKFNKGFYLDKFKFIRAIANHNDGSSTLAGQLNIIRCVPKTVKKICFVNVGIIENGVPHWDSVPNINVHIKNLRKLLSQAHVIIPENNIVIQSLPISIDRGSLLFDYQKSIQGKTYLFKYAPNNSKSIGQIIEAEFNKKYKYFKNALKLFLCSYDCDRRRSDTQVTQVTQLELLGGHAVSIPGKSVIVFHNDPNKPENAFIPCHELLHSFGLWHSFSNNSPYTFLQFYTSNIMDYPAFYNQISLWRWQWDIIRKSKEVKDTYFWRHWITKPTLSKI